MSLTQDNANSLLMLGFALTMVLVFCHALKLYYFNNRASAVSFYANTLTSLGILGTFVGIALGILYFDTQAIDKSLILMIEGLKTAFLTSIGGLALSILLKQLTYHWPNKADKEFEFGEEPDLVAAIEGQTETLNLSLSSFQQGLGKQIVNQLNLIVEQFNQRIAGQFGDQLPKMSAEFTQLNDQLFEFSTRIVQFEQNMNLLNESVGDFQQQHRERAQQLTDLADAITEGNQLLSDSVQLVNAQEQNSQQQLLASETLADKLSHIESKLQSFNNQLKDFNDNQWQEQEHISQSFTEKFTRLEQQLVGAINDVREQAINSNDQLLAQLDHSADVQQQLSGELATSVDLQQQANQQLLTQMTQLSEATQSVTEKNATYVDEVFQRTLEQLTTSYAEQKDHWLAQQQSSSDAISEAMNEFKQQHQLLLEQHYQTYQAQLQQEMEQTLKQLNDVMGFVGGEFARDFQQLIGQMNAVNSELARQVSESYD